MWIREIHLWHQVNFFFEELRKENYYLMTWDYVAGTAGGSRESRWPRSNLCPHGGRTLRVGRQNMCVNEVNIRTAYPKTDEFRCKCTRQSAHILCQSNFLSSGGDGGGAGDTGRKWQPPDWLGLAQFCRYGQFSSAQVLLSLRFCFFLWQKSSIKNIIPQITHMNSLNFSYCSTVWCLPQSNGMVTKCQERSGSWGWLRTNITELRGCLSPTFWPPHEHSGAGWLHTLLGSHSTHARAHLCHCTSHMSF